MCNGSTADRCSTEYIPVHVNEGQVFSMPQGCVLQTDYISVANHCAIVNYCTVLQVGRLDCVLILVGLAPCLLSSSASSVFMVPYMFNFFLYTLHFGELGLVGLALDMSD